MRLPVLFTRVAEAIRGNPAFRDEYSRLAASHALLREGLADLERDMEEIGWRRVSGQGQFEFTPHFRQLLMQEARAYYLKNPMIARGIDLRADYVFGQGVTVSHQDPEINEVIQAFWTNRKNRAAFTGDTMLIANEVSLAVEGDFFLVCFADSSSAKTQVRIVPASQILDIVCNPEDAQDPWYYLRSWVETDPMTRTQKQREAYYPALFYEPEQKPTQILGKPVLWDSPILHAKVGGLPDMQFGVSETYRGQDWARAHRKYLEDCSSFWSALARFAWQLTGKGDPKKIQEKLGTQLGANPGQTPDRNPASVAGSFFLPKEGTKLEPMRIGGAGPDPNDGRPYMLYIAASQGMNETFYGDADVGNHATSKTLDRPFELTVLARQKLWRGVIQDVLRYVIERAAIAPNGPLRHRLVVDVPGEGIELTPGEPDGGPVTAVAEVKFPPVLEHDVANMMTAVVQAATLDGKQPASWISTPEGTLVLARMLLSALGEQHMDEVMEKLFPGGEAPEADIVEPPLAEAVAKLTQAIQEARR